MRSSILEEPTHGRFCTTHRTSCTTRAGRRSELRAITPTNELTSTWTSEDDAALRVLASSRNRFSHRSHSI
ncbi:hypothetical protein AR158_c536R [Paramecium bursaria Chlorella virus AR158]|uniref:hypothetical protein n=1 Tax=Paramecium bursaria Chlorella virus AR158 TaxID=380598 RepID=UPI00015AA755|nr:hypothetical protein AR158_c536R [Paramecium bursaria Chlorella virus AR158]ABU44081.1 hypothetical protein AR158_c536R [Paramecium bursaria Chlorella virus AR158]